MPDSRIWFVRAEHNNAVAYHFLENGIVHMGWGIGPVSPDDSQNDIKARLRKLYPDRSQTTLSKWAREIREFNQDMLVGDTVATYEPRMRTYHIGEIKVLLISFEDDVTYDWDNDHVHRVEWQYRVGRDILPKGFAKSNLDRRSTLHRLSAEASAVMKRYCSE